MGRWLIAVACVHNFGSLTWTWKDAVGIYNNGIFNTVFLGSEYFEAYFFWLWGFLCLLFGFAVDVIEKHKISPFPKTITYTLVAFTIFTVIISPASGFWSLIPPAIWMIRLSHKKRIAE